MNEELCEWCDTLVPIEKTVEVWCSTLDDFIIVCLDCEKKVKKNEFSRIYILVDGF